MAFCRALPERAGVVAIPTQVFYDDQTGPGPAPGALGVLQDPEVISDGVARLQRADLSSS